METDKKAYTLIIAVSILFICAVPLSMKLLDNDVFYHLLIAKQMIESGQPYFFNQPYFNHPQGILHYYPPLFHWILALTSLIVGLENAPLIWKPLFYPLAVFSFYHLVSKSFDKKTAYYSLIVLSTVFPFLARTHMAIPEALQYILIPLIFYAYLENKEKTCGLLLLMALINHLYDSLLIALVILAHARFNRNKGYAIHRTLLIALPGLIIQLYGITGHMMVYSPPIDLWFLNQKINLALSGTSMLLLLGLYYATRQLNNPKNTIYLLWIISSIPVLFILPGRFPAYAAMPLSVIGAISLMDLRKNISDKKIYLLVVFLLLVLNLLFSTLFYPHIYDYMKPGIDEQEEKALNWIKQNITLDEVVSVGSAGRYYEGYKIAYYSGHKTTDSWNKSRYLYALYDVDDSGWNLSAQYGRYRIYERTI